MVLTDDGMMNAALVIRQAVEHFSQAVSNMPTYQHELARLEEALRNFHDDVERWILDNPVHS
jgi:hypothetical protein